MSNKPGKIRMLKIYGTTCFLNGVVLDKNPLTVHHIVPKREHGKDDISNYALLCRLEHDMFNVIEMNNKKDAEYLNNGFKRYKETKDFSIILELREFVDARIKELGYCVEDRGTCMCMVKKHLG